jgi:hypothetical protein
MAVKPGATSGDVRATCEGILRDRRVNSAAVQLSPNDVTSTPEGEYMEIRVTAPSDRNSVLPLRFFRGTNIDATAVVMKEL